MFQLRKGSHIPFPEKLVEGYMVEDNRITANISAEKIGAVMAHFIRMREEPVFFILELPANQATENADSSGFVEAFHTDVYYIDDCSKEEALSLLDRIGPLLINDGLCSFGFGGHESQDEIMFGKYNVATIFSDHIDEYKSFFAEHDIPENDRLITAWDTFSLDHPGESERIVTDGKDVFSIPDEFSKWGMYKAETR